VRAEWTETRHYQPPPRKSGVSTGGRRSGNAAIPSMAGEVAVEVRGEPRWRSTDGRPPFAGRNMSASGGAGGRLSVGRRPTRLEAGAESNESQGDGKGSIASSYTPHATPQRLAVDDQQG